MGESKRKLAATYEPGLAPSVMQLRGGDPA